MPRERETLDVNVCIVGAGPAGLAAAIRLSDLCKSHNERVSAGLVPGGKPVCESGIVVIEKAAELGFHTLSGAVMDPVALTELIPDFEAQGFPSEGKVHSEALLMMTRTGTIPFPFTPPPLRNDGNHIVSLHKVVRWMGAQAQARGVEVFTGFPGSETLLNGRRVAGVRTMDRGVDKDGSPKANYEPGPDVKADVTVFAEGPRGSLAKALTARLGLADGKNPQIYATGVKEVWRVRPGSWPAGRVVHTMAYPLSSREYGGGFIYPMKDDLLSLGFVVGLDYRNPAFDPHRSFQEWKAHPFVARALEGGELLHYGAKTLPEGGWYSIPKNHGDGFLVVGDSGGYLNAQRLKGIHLAIKTGMLAAETIFEALVRGDTSDASLAGFEARVEKSYVRDELYKVRNFRQGFAKGMYPGLVYAGIGLVTGGWAPGVDSKLTPDFTHMRKRRDAGEPVRHLSAYDGKLTVDKLTDVFHSGTTHDEHQPSHLKVADLDVCRTRCAEEFGNPCQHFCPAAVYEMVDDDARGGKKLQINFSNCVHCKTCDVMDPYELITWTTPEGGDGPKYVNL
ncbi:MAG: 4Fe-4S dicluster domain-containing protein [bacterium]